MIQRCLAVLSLTLAAATTASAAPGGPPTYEAAFIRTFPDRQFGPAGPYYPHTAGQRGYAGDAVIQCHIVPPAPGRLTGCLVVSETPQGLMFGAAAREMAAAGVIAVTPDGGPPPPPGAVVRVHVPFTIGR
ncbi:MAG TPA: hypothetical protein VFE13_12820 [Caulobacteraceae bacterium]|jgi:hypothetical protein|nr:hypothetical protein [Caulobacteraceae bacterium]